MVTVTVYSTCIHKTRLEYTILILKGLSQVEKLAALLFNSIYNIWLEQLLRTFEVLVWKLSQTQKKSPDDPMSDIFRISFNTWRSEKSMWVYNSPAPAWHLSRLLTGLGRHRPSSPLSRRHLSPWSTSGRTSWRQSSPCLTASDPRDNTFLWCWCDQAAWPLSCPHWARRCSLLPSPDGPQPSDISAPRSHLTVSGWTSYLLPSPPTRAVTWWCMVSCHCLASWTSGQWWPSVPRHSTISYSCWDFPVPWKESLMRNRLYVSINRKVDNVCWHIGGGVIRFGHWGSGGILIRRNLTQDNDNVKLN